MKSSEPMKDTDIKPASLKTSHPACSDLRNQHNDSAPGLVLSNILRIFLRITIKSKKNSNLKIAYFLE